jgi:hypothetical protein
MKDAVEMGSGAMIYIYIFMKLVQAFKIYWKWDAYTGELRAGWHKRPTFIFFKRREVDEKEHMFHVEWTAQHWLPGD